MGNATPAAPDRPVATPALQQLRTFLGNELRPTPGRLRAASIRVAGVVLAMCAGYALNVPEISAVVALAFFGSVVNRDESKKVALGVPPIVLAIFLMLMLVLNIFGTAPLVRTLCFIVVIFGSLFMLQAAREGQVFLLAGVFGKLFLELWDSGYPAFLTQELCFWIVVDLGLAGVCALLVSSLFGKPGKDPAKIFRSELAKRFELMGRCLDGTQPTYEDWERVRAEAFCAREQLMRMLDSACKKDSTIRRHRARLSKLVRINQLLLHECVVLHTDLGEESRRSPDAVRWCGVRCRAIAHLIRAGSLIASHDKHPEGIGHPFDTLLVDTIILAEGVAAGRSSSLGDEAEKGKSFFRPDAFTNPLYLKNATGAFTAAFACYCLVSGAHWSGIGTAVTTCLITALTTVEQSRQKQSLRIAGAAAGGILTYFVLIVVLPAGVGLAGLVVVTALVTFLAGWIYAGGPRLNYAGVQLGLCYFLGIFGENKTPTSLTTVRDRIVGIFIGNLAMWLFYDRIRPAWTANASRPSFADEAESIARLASEPTGEFDLHKAVEQIERELETFDKARSALRAMSDTSSPAFSPWAKAQQRDSPGIKDAEAHLCSLFSLEFVQSVSVCLGLPVLSRPVEQRGLREHLLTLSSKLRSGSAIVTSERDTRGVQVSEAEWLLKKTQAALATLFRANTKGYG